MVQRCDPLLALILAAGEGTRMRSSLPKVLHPLCEKPLLQRVIDAVGQLNPAAIGIVVGYGADQVQKQIPSSDMLQYIVQTLRQGSGDAVRCAATWLQANAIDDKALVLILCGDTPLVTVSSLQKLIATHQKEQASVTILSECVAQPFGYGRIVRQEDGGQVVAIVEEKDATLEQKQINEVNSGIYCFNVKALLSALPKLKNENAKKEYYLTDTIQILRQENLKVQADILDSNNAGQTMGVNSKVDLSAAEALLQQKIQQQWMQQGVTILQTSSTYIGQDVILEAGAVILPGSMILGKSYIAKDSRIGPNSYLENAHIGAGCSVQASFVVDSQLQDHVKVGPFAHIRGQSHIGSDCRIGNFTEIKKSQFGVGSKASHLSYVGDAQVGQKVNIGAGTITCNYDGKNKHATVLGDGVFVGSNTNLVAPVTIGAQALIGAGSTITKDVPPKALSVERSKQIIKSNWVKK